MKPAPFAYHRPRNLAEATDLLAELAPQDGRVLAGGQSLVPIMAFRLARPAHLVDINHIGGLDRLAVEDGILRIGACVRHAAFERAAAPGPLGGLLSRVVHHIGHYPIRLRGTFCGSLAHADPAAEWCLVATSLDAELVALSRRGERRFDAQSFFLGPMTTALAADELLTEVRLPILPGGTGVGFAEFSRRAGDFALAMALAAIRIEERRVVAARIGLGGVEVVPRRSEAAEAALVGAPAGDAAFHEAAARAAAAIDPLDDAQSDARYRRELAAAMVYRALQQANREAADG